RSGRRAPFSGLGCSGTSSILAIRHDTSTRNTPVRQMLIEKDSYELDGCRETLGTQLGRHGLGNDGVHGERERRWRGPDCGEPERQGGEGRNAAGGAGRERSARRGTW